MNPRGPPPDPLFGGSKRAPIYEGYVHFLGGLENQCNRQANPFREESGKGGDSSELDRGPLFFWELGVRVPEAPQGAPPGAPGDPPGGPVFLRIPHKKGQSRRPDEGPI